MLRRIEWSVALLLTLLAVALHFVFLQHAGALWRDEAGAVSLATMPQLSDVGANLHYDSFPILWVLVVRFWSALGLGGDAGLRLLGFLTGISVLGALWFNARTFKISFPLVSLTLLGFWPILIIWGDTMRAWGWGVLWILLTLGFAWRVVESPRTSNILVFALAALASVQSTYYNSVLLFAICAGGITVAARRRSKQTAVALLAVGIVAAISMLPYTGVLQRGADEYVILRAPFGMSDFIEKLADAVSVPGTVSLAAWILVLVAGIFAGSVCLVRHERLKVAPAQRDLLLFSVTTLAVGTAGYFLFLKQLQVVTMPWYYAALLAIAATTLEAMLSALADDDRRRVARVGFAIVVPLLMFFPAWKIAHLRLTNIDAVAKTVSASAAPGDFIIVNPWFCGVSFARYYNGAAAWAGLPDVKDYKVHHYDTIKEMMMAPEPSQAINDVIARMETALKSGKHLWVVAGPVLTLRPGSPPKLMTAPNGPMGWNCLDYEATWSTQAGIFVSAHVKSVQKVQAPDSAPLERMLILVMEGWRDN